MPELTTPDRMDDLVFDEASLAIATRLRESFLDVANDYIGLALAAALSWKRDESLIDPTSQDEYSLLAFSRKQASERKAAFFYNAWHMLKLVLGPEVEVLRNPARMPGFSILLDRAGNIDRDTLENLESKVARHEAGETRALLSAMYTVTAPGFDLDEGRRLMEASL